MAENRGHKSAVQKSAKRTQAPAQRSKHDHASPTPTATSDAPSYSPSLLASPSIVGRGNAPVQISLLGEMQQTQGNRAVQRFLKQSSASPTSSGPSPHSSAASHISRDVQRFLQRSGQSAAPAGGNIGERIESRSGGGSSLEPGVQGRLESGLGADLSGVRVHTDGEADNLAQSVSSVAFTSGQDIFFSQGAYNPSSEGGMHLLAHEAAHTVQQSQGPVSGTPTDAGVSISDPSDSYEQAADHAADNVMSGAHTSAPASAQRTLAPSPSGLQRVAVQRCGPVPCNCSPEEKANALQKMPELSIMRTRSLDIPTPRGPPPAASDLSSTQRYTSDLNSLLKVRVSRRFDVSADRPFEATSAARSQRAPPIQRHAPVQRFSLPNPLDLAKKLAEKAMGFIKNLGSSALNTAKNLGNSAWNTAKSVGSTIANTAKNAGQGLWNMVKSAGQSVANGVKSAGSRILEAAKRAGKSVVDAARKAGLAVAKAVQSTGQKIWSTVKNLGSKALEGAKKLGTAAWEKAKSLGTSLWNKVKGLASSTFAMFKKKVQDAWARVKTLATNAYKKATSLAAKARDLARKVEKGATADKLCKALSDLTGKAYDVIAPKVRKALAVAKDLGGKAWNFAKSKAQSLWDGAKSLGKKVADGAKKFGSNVYKTAKNMGKKAWDMAKKLGGAAFDTARKLGTAAWNKAKAMGTAAWNKAKAMGTAAWNNAKALGQKAWNFAKSKGEAIWNAAKQGASRLLGIADKLTGGMSSKVAGMAQKILGKASGLLSWVMNAARSLADRALNAAKSLAQKALKTAQDIGRKAAETAQKLARKAVETAQKLAKQAAETARKLAKQAADAAQRLAKQAFEGAKKLAKQAVDAAKNWLKKQIDTAKQLGAKAWGLAKKLGSAALATARSWGGKIKGVATGFMSKISKAALFFKGKAVDFAKALGLDKAFDVAKKLGEEALKLVKSAFAKLKQRVMAAAEKARKVFEQEKGIIQKILPFLKTASPNSFQMAMTAAACKGLSCILSTVNKKFKGESKSAETAEEVANFATDVIPYVSTAKDLCRCAIGENILRGSEEKVGTGERVLSCVFAAVDIVTLGAAGAVKGGVKTGVKGAEAGAKAASKGKGLKGLFERLLGKGAKAGEEAAAKTAREAKALEEASKGAKGAEDGGKLGKGGKSVLEGVLSKGPSAEAGHNLLITKGGFVIRCSPDCPFMRQVYKKVLAKSAPHEARMAAIEVMAREAGAAGDVARANEARQLARELEEELRWLQQQRLAGATRRGTTTFVQFTDEAMSHISQGHVPQMFDPVARLAELNRGGLVDPNHLTHLFPPGLVSDERALSNFMRQAIESRQAAQTAERVFDVEVRGIRVRVVTGALPGGAGTRIVSFFPVSGTALTRREIEAFARSIETGASTIGQVRAQIARLFR